MKRAILLVNLGTPDSCTPKDVSKYLVQFLTDKRVIDLPPIKRNLLVRLAIVPKRAPFSAAIYKSIWTQEGSPLLVHTRKISELLQKELGNDYWVCFAMRYQNPSIKEVIRKLNQSYLEELIILPLFPQYSSATSGSVVEEVMEEMKSWETFPKIRVITEFSTHPSYIEAMSHKIASNDIEKYDHIMFSYHGLPKSHILKADKYGTCFRQGCCQERTVKSFYCYKAQCYATTHAIARKLNIAPSKYSVSFQSRLGKQEWIKPYTSDELHRLTSVGVRKLLVAAPSFICDCIETIDEIAKEYKELFISFGGTKLDLVEGLNEDPLWIKALKEICLGSEPKAKRPASISEKPADIVNV